MRLKDRTQLCCWVDRKECCLEEERGQLSLKGAAMLGAAGDIRSNGKIRGALGGDLSGAW